MPFPWGSKLSGVGDEADVAWYARTVRVPESWKGKRVFLVVGASDWRTSGWLDGEPIGSYQGGYTPFDLELTKAAKPGREQRLVLRVDDTPHPFKLEGKQGYGKARGLWQTVYLEARPAVYVEALEFHPDPALKRVEARVRLSSPAPQGAIVELKVSNGGPGDPSFSQAQAQALVAVGGREARLTLPLGESPRLWSLEDPFLYDATLTLSAGGAEDRVKSYFGLRKLGVERPPGLGHPYVSLNGKPVYLQMTLDQSWNPDGFWNWPTDEAMREEILIARRLGLNAIRTHVKVEVPRKLYWADRLGVLVMADVPNSWGEPDEAMRKEWETALRGMVRRDFNHPSVFSWVLFNEQWGLQTKGADGEGLLAPRDAGVGREVLRPREGARPDAPRRGQLPLLRRRAREDGPQLVAHVPARVEVEGDARRGRGEDLPRLDLELRGRPRAGRGAHAQQRVRQRLGLRGLDGRRGLELRLPRHDGRAAPPPEGGGLALHGAPRRDQRVERLRARRPLGEGDGPRRARAGDDSARLARAPLRGGGRLPGRRRRSRARRCRCRCGPRSSPTPLPAPSSR